MDEHIALRFDWYDILDQPIEAVLGLNSLALSNGSASWDAVALCTQLGAVMLTIEPPDQVVVSLEKIPSGDGWRPIPSFDFAISRSCGWCWVGINPQGYKDSFTLAFGDVIPDALHPRCTFVAEGSSLICYDLLPRMT